MSPVWLRLCFTFIPVLLLLANYSARAQSPTGREFIVVLPAVLGQQEMNRDIADFTIEVSCMRRTNVALKWADGTPILTSQVEPGLRAIFKKPLYALWKLMQSSLDLDAEKPNRRALLVTADQPVTVQAVFDTNYRAETYQVFPVSSYDTLYTLVNYAGYSASGDRTGFVVMAAEDNTVVRISTTAQRWRGIMPNEDITINLNRYEIAQVVSAFRSTGPESDMTGTVIRSNRPVGLLSFSAASSVPGHALPPPPPRGGSVDDEGSFSVKLMIEHQCPQKMAGTEFYTLPFRRYDPNRVEIVHLVAAPGFTRPRRDTSLLRFVVLEGGTTFDTNGRRLKNVAGGDSVFPRGSRFDLEIVDAMKVTASKPVVGMQFMYSGYAWGMFDTVDRDDTLQVVPFGNPSMTYLPPVSQFKPNLQASVPLLDERPPPLLALVRTDIFWQHRLLVTAPVSAVGKVKINGNGVNLPYVHSDGKYASGYVRVHSGQRELIESPEPISVISYGLTWLDSYATTAGESARSFAKATPDTLRFFICSGEKDTTITLSNLGTGDFRLDSLRITGIDASLLAPLPLPRTFAPSGQDRLIIRFKAPTPGTYSGVIRIYTDANNQAVLDVPFVITRDSAKLELPAGAIDFGALTSTQGGRDTLIVLRNNGSRPLVIDAITFTGTGYGLIGVTFPRTIQPGAADTLRLRFTPTADGLSEGTMRIVGTPCLQPVNVALRGYKGSGATALVRRVLVYAGILCISPSAMDSVIVLRNVGDEAVVIASAVIEGVHKDEFTLLDVIDGRSVAPGDTLLFRVRYTPGGYGERRASLKLLSNAKNAPQIDIALIARKDTVALAPAVDTVRFGRVLGCGDTLEQTLTVRNTGTVADTITVADIDGDGPFLVGTQLPLILHPSTSQEITIRFLPGADGSFKGRLRLHGAPCDVEAGVLLTGERISPSLAAARLTFDTVYDCERLPVVPVVVTNNGPVPSTITGASDGGSGILLVQNSAFPREIAPGEADTFYVTFNPSGNGRYDGVLSFTYEPCDMSLDVPASGFRASTATALSRDTVDFGTTNINTPVRRLFTFYNHGTTPRRLLDIVPGMPSRVKVVRPAVLPVTVPAGDSVEIELEYQAPIKGALESTLRLNVAEPCGYDTTIALIGTAVGDEVIATSFTVAAPKTQGEVDSEVEIPISVENWTNVSAAAPSGLLVRLRYRYTLLAPVGVTTPLAGVSANIIGDRIEGSERIITLEMTGSGFPEEGEVARLRCVALIGDTDVTALDIDSVAVRTPPNRTATIATRDGEFLTLGICRTGGDRFIRLGGTVRLKSVAPNPFRDLVTVEFENDREMPIVLRLYDANGTLVATVTPGTMLAGRHALLLDGRTLPSGVYICEIEGAGQRPRALLLLEQ